MPIIPVDYDELGFIERICFLREKYTLDTGRMPTRLVLTPFDLMELSYWLTSDANKDCYIGPPLAIEPEIYGMTMRIDNYAGMMRVYFQES